MSVELVRKEIERFLESADPEVLCLRGDWGVGKTFTWNSILRAACLDKRIGLKKYAYVSMFGLNSLDDCRRTIFENTVSEADISRRPSVATASENLQKYAAPALGVLSKLPFVGPWAAAAERLSPFLMLAIADQIICIDDLERKGRGIEVKDVLGLISNLREQRGCKIVILSNTDALEEGDKQQFDDYLEKVVDVFLEFAPTSSECTQIALASDPYQLSAACRKLGLANIRIIKKIERLVKQVAASLERYHPKVQHQAVQSLIVFGWVRFGKNAPSFEFLSNRRSAQFMRVIASDQQVQEDPQTAAWNALLDAYPFGGVDEFDRVLWEGVLRGYFDFSKLDEQAARLSEAFIAADGSAAHSDAWRVFHDSFDDNEREVGDTMFAVVRDNMKHLEAGSVDDAIEMLRELERGEDARSLIEDYVRTHEGKPTMFDVDRMSSFRPPRDSEFVEALRKKHAEMQAERSPLEALLQMNTPQGSRDDLRVAAQVTSDELYAALKTRRGMQLRELIGDCLHSDRILNARRSERAIANKAKEALKRIGAESRINAMRIRRFGNLEPVVTGQEEEDQS